MRKTTTNYPADFDEAVEQYLLQTAVDPNSSPAGLFEAFPDRKSELEFILESLAEDSDSQTNVDQLPPPPNHIDATEPHDLERGSHHHESSPIQDTDRTNLAQHDTNPTPQELPDIGRVSRASSFELPRRIGSYELFELLDEGGMGVVYKARSIGQRIERIVAVKVIKPEIGGTEIQSRFARECQSLALMNHPNIATIYEGGLTQDGDPFLAMEYVSGTNLIEHCRRLDLQLEQRLDLFAQICYAVHHAHQKGIIHRDLKPANILVADAEEQDSAAPKVIDFGLAKLESLDESTRSSHTQLGQILGTLHYMSPEGATLRPSAIDTRSDIFSLGVILFELLTGTTPLEESLTSNLPIDEKLRAVRSQEPLRPSQRTKRYVTASPPPKTLPAIAPTLVRGDLDAICMMALASAPEERYESAAALGTDIQNYLAGAPVAAKGNGAAYTLSKLAVRYRKQLAVVLSMAALLLLTTAASVSMAFRARRAEADASNQLIAANAARAAEQAALQEAESERELAQEINSFLRNDLLKQASPYQQSNAMITLREVVAIAAEKINERFEGKPRVRGELHTTVGEVLTTLQDYENADPHWRQAYDLIRESVGDSDLQTFRVTQGFAKNCTNLGLMEESERLLRHSLNLIPQADEDFAVARLALQRELAIVLYRVGREPEAIPMLKQLVEESQARSSEDGDSSLYYKSDLANALIWQSRHAEALPIALEVFEEAQKNYPPGSPWIVIQAGNVARCYAFLGQFEEAFQLLEQSREATEKTYGKASRAWQANRRTYVICLRIAGRLEEAEKTIRELIDLHPLEETPILDRANNARELSRILEERGQEDGAIEVIRDIFHLHCERFGPHDYRSILWLSELGDVLNDSKRYTEAQEVIGEHFAIQAGVFTRPIALQERRAVKHWLRALKGLKDWSLLLKSSRNLLEATPSGAPSWEMERARIQFYVGYALKELDQSEEAIATLRSAFEVSNHFFGPYFMPTIDDTLALADALVDLEEYDEAQQLYLSALDANGVNFASNNAAALHAIRELNDVADSYRAQKKFPLALELHTALESYVAKHLGQDHPETLSIRNGHGRTLNASGRRQEASACYERALALAGPSTEKNRPPICYLLHNWGLNLHAQEDWSQAADVWKMACHELALRYDSKLHHRVQRALVYQANALLKSDQHEKATRIANQVFRESTDESDWNSASRLKKMEALAKQDEEEASPIWDVALALAHVFIDLGEYGEAKEIALWTLRANVEGDLSKSRLEIIAEVNDVADRFRDQERFADALELHDMLEKTVATKLGNDHPETLSLRNGRGRTLKAGGRLEEANAWYERVVDLAGPSKRKNRTQYCTLMYNWGMSLDGQGDWERAAQVWQRAQNELETRYGASYYRTARAAVNRAETLLEIGHRREAKEIASKLFRLNADTPEKELEANLSAMEVLAQVIDDQDEMENFAQQLSTTYDAVKTHEALSPAGQARILTAASLCFRKASSSPENLTRSLDFAQRAVQARKTLAPDDERTGIAFRELGNAYLANGQLQKAEEAFLESHRILRTEASPSESQKKTIDLTTQCLIDLYESTGRSQLASQWASSLSLEE